MNALRERWEQLAEAWRVADVRRGMYGTLLIAVGSLTPAYLPRNSPWWPIMRWAHLDNPVAKVAFNLLVLAGVALLVQAWFRLRPAGGVPHRTTETWHDLRHWAVLLIWGLPFVFAPPIFSHDAYSYAAQGWMLHNGVDPYQQGPGVLPGGFADQVAWVWRFTPAPYGPLALQMSHLLVDVSGFDPYLAALLMRIPALIGVGLIGLCIPRLATLMRVDPAFAAWFATLNPVLVIDFIGGAHNDSLMMGLVVFAVYVAHKAHWGWLPAAVVVGVAAAIKQPALLAAYALPLIRRPWRTVAPSDVAIVVFRALVALGLAGGVFALISVVSGLYFGWYNAVNVPGMVTTVSPFTVLGQGLKILFDLVGWEQAAEVSVRYSRAVGLAASVIVLAVGAVTVARRRPITYLSWSYLAVAIFAPALHSWYVLWGGLLLPLARPSAKVVRAAIVATIVLLSYAAVNLSMRNGAVALGVAALAAYGFQVWSHERRTRAEMERAEQEATHV
ncbi:polyprenol phosphomannose-dependent alpha 1,6 mannosyltransferase MptB [Aestuariimicrobium soli]|uniref:polyprenol phosphomannose-dependent alpha 1,6 mannosyltransferase MptB n=1 Tax=Aestuariimicrobium soli TaxID=2035834 RepID=UPI003EBA9F59